MVVFNVPVSGILKVQTPDDKTRINKSYLLADKSNLSIKETTKNQFNIYLPAQAFKQPFVIVLETAEGVKGGKQYQDAKT